ncbi:MAG: sulfotransferase domain-containing protein [Hyphomicrobiales bacterium]|nr:sulfotransferase domain-containing protein [Hyphomicrobiales bacterium]
MDIRAPQPQRTEAGTAASFRHPNLFIVGAQKCGTTALADYLREHPDIFVPMEKEFWFYCDDIERKVPIMPEWRFKLAFEDWDKEKYAVDASPLYMFSTEAHTRIKECSPDAKIIIMLREPAEMAYSLFYQLKYGRNEDADSFEAALDLEPERAAGRSIPSNVYFRINTQYTFLGKYADHVQTYFDTFGRDNVHVIIYDDFRADTQASYLAVLAFLGLDPHTAVEFSVRNPNQRSRTRSLNRLAQRPPKWMGAITGLFFSREARWRVRQWIKKLNSVDEPRPPMRPETRARLNAVFAEDVDRLGRLLGRDLSHWVAPPKASSDPEAP